MVETPKSPDCAVETSDLTDRAVESSTLTLGGKTKIEDTAALVKLLQVAVEPNRVLLDVIEALEEIPSIIDLRLDGPLYAKLPESISLQYDDYMDAYTTRFLGEKYGAWLRNFFVDQDLSARQWQARLDGASSQDEDVTSLIRVVRASLPIFLKAFQLGHESPLSDVSVQENVHLNSFVHPTLEAACWQIANVHYPCQGLVSYSPEVAPRALRRHSLPARHPARECPASRTAGSTGSSMIRDLWDGYVFGEIPLKRYNISAKQKSDGLGVTDTPDRFPVCTSKEPSRTRQKTRMQMTEQKSRRTCVDVRETGH
ncbi:uncharacterized protein EV422DRAFT_338803 [Fimicolochytrium jonesii]|uniref:uncharacterized protein n=1 Tax=Fimicolochytrium jonesii TaxID=1396493 RepID=UPI0022FDD47B|nr:uncharacterized protein EV422DRAFT_338803 [Fimicolochytrium jonesii]KAI8815852.1 hypothetical protein EV422DRAFT_338803 [Fimicolochytrium jonesii]